MFLLLGYVSTLYDNDSDNDSDNDNENTYQNSFNSPGYGFRVINEM